MKEFFRSTAELLLEDMDVCNLFSKISHAAVV